jgi:hypothetical protein
VPRFVCQAATCRREIALLPANGTGQISKPRCTCGSEMKKVYSKPVFRELIKAEALVLLGGRSQYVSWELFHEKNIYTF